MLKLYRGVNKGNKTMPEKYPYDGLWTKQVNSWDDPEPHNKYGWTATIANHIHYTNESEKFVYDTTQYLSFSSDRQTALSFIGGTKNRSFEPAIRPFAGAFLFTGTFDSALMEIGKGVYIYHYTCNYGRCFTDPDFTSPMSVFCKCNICHLSPGYLHKVILIDAEQFLFGMRDEYPNEYQKALWDKEWLLMPADPMMDPSGKGFQSRIFIADFWSVEFYKYTNL